MKMFTLTLIGVLFTACSTKTIGGYSYTSGLFEKKGWIKVDKYELGDNTAYNRVIYEKKRFNINYFIKINGYPDYYYTTDLFDVYYGYLKSGKIYQLKLGAGRNRIINTYNYTDPEILHTLPAIIYFNFKNKNTIMWLPNSYLKIEELYIKSFILKWTG